MKRPRVMHLVVGGDIGGAERLIVDIARRPEDSSADHEIAVLTPNRALFALFAYAGLTVHDRGKVRENPLAYLYRSLGPADVAWVTRVIKTRRVDILHTHTFGSHVLGTRAAGRARIPQLRTEHHVMHYADPSCSPFTRWAAKRTQRLVAVSEYVHRVLRETAPDLTARMTVIRNGVDERHFAPRDRGETFSAVIVGRLTRWKRVDWAVEACADANVPLTIVGDGEERRSLERLAAKRDAPVTFVGHQSDPRPFFARSSVTLNASTAEAMPLSVLESLAMERPVVAFAAGGIPEVVQHEVTGWLAIDPSPRALSVALLRARDAGNKLASMGAAARRFVADHASIGAMCRGYAREYEAMWQSR